jgi:hypothetical protein
MGLPSLAITSGMKTVEGPMEATVGGGCVLVGRGALEV